MGKHQVHIDAETGKRYIICEGTGKPVYIKQCETAHAPGYFPEGEVMALAEPYVGPNSDPAGDEPDTDIPAEDELEL